MPVDFKTLSDEELHESARRTAREERRLTEVLLEHLREVESRKLFAKRGFSSLWEYVTRELGYDGGAAQRRIQAMRLSKELPEVKEALREEKVSLTSAAMLQSFFENERRNQKKTYAPEEKREVLRRIEGLTSRETERALREISPLALPRERERVITSTETEIRFVADAQMMEQIGRMKELLSGSHPNPSLEEVFRRALTVAVEKLDPGSRHPKMKSVAAPEKRPETGRGEPKRESVQRQHVSRSLRRATFDRSGHRCTHVSPETGRRCEARRGLQIEHVRPRVLGGTNEPGNLTVLCGAHNRLRAEEVVGSWVRKYGRGAATAR